MTFKNLFSLVLLGIGVLFLSSCGDDAHDEDIAGTWNITLVSSTGCDDPDDNLNQDLTANNGCVMEQGIEICTEGTMVITAAGGLTINLIATSGGVSFTETVTGTITVNDDDTVTLCSDGDCEDGTCTIDGDDLIIATTNSTDNCRNEVRATRA